MQKNCMHQLTAHLSPHIYHPVQRFILMVMHVVLIISYPIRDRKLHQRLRAEYFFWCNTNIFINLLLFQCVMYLLLLKS